MPLDLNSRAGGLIARRLAAPAGPWLATGLLARVAAGAGRGATIVMYHRVADDVQSTMVVSTRRFREQMEYLRAHYRPVSLPEIEATLRAGATPPARTVAVTFDDGYRDNLTHAAPILTSLGIPATLFMATGPQEWGKPLWWDALDIAGQGGRTVRAQLKRVTQAALNRAVDQALESLPRPQVASAVARLYLTWDDLRAWLRLGMDVGAHTVTHPILSKLSLDQARSEICASRDTLEREIERPITTFAYPNGRRGDFTAATEQLLAGEGFTSAYTTMEAKNDRATNLLALRRYSARDESVPMFALRLSGLRTALRPLVARSR